MMKTIYLAGGCYWGVEKYVSQIKGVVETQVGFANGNTNSPTYEQVKHENTGHAETVKVTYDPERLPLRSLLNLFFLIIDPTSVDMQGGDVGHQYRTGIYYLDEQDGQTARAALDALAKRTNASVVVECEPLAHFWTAEEYHQKYLDKNPSGYCHVPLDKLRWIGTVDPAEYDY